MTQPAFRPASPQCSAAFPADFRFRFHVLRSLLVYRPDIAKRHGIAVILQKQAELAWALRPITRRAGSELEIVMDHDSVVLHRDAGVGGFFTGVVVFGGSEIDVVGLPGKRWKAH